MKTLSDDNGGISMQFIGSHSGLKLSLLKLILLNPLLSVMQNIIAKDGLVNGLLIRGLGTKILANGAQGE